MFLQGVGGPRVKHDVQELTDVTSDLLGLASGLLTNDGDEPWTESVLNDELETHQAAGGHHFSAVLDQVDHRRQQKF